jgi:hypothetical protein
MLIHGKRNSRQRKADICPKNLAEFPLNGAENRPYQAAQELLYQELSSEHAQAMVTKNRFRNGSVGLIFPPVEMDRLLSPFVALRGEAR